MTTSPIWGHAPAERTKKHIWHKGSHGRCNHLFQISSKSVKWFPGCEGPKMGVSHWLWLSPLQQVSTTVLPVICHPYLNYTFQIFVNDPLLCRLNAESWKHCTRYTIAQLLNTQQSVTYRCVLNSHLNSSSSMSDCHQAWYNSKWQTVNFKNVNEFTVCLLTKHTFCTLRRAQQSCWVRANSYLSLFVSCGRDVPVAGMTRSVSTCWWQYHCLSVLLSTVTTSSSINEQTN